MTAAIKPFALALGISLLLFAAPVAPAAAPQEPAQLWRNMDKASHLGGPALDPADLKGVPVLVVRYNLSGMKSSSLHTIWTRACQHYNSQLAIVGSIKDEKASERDFAARAAKSGRTGIIATDIIPHYARFGLASGEPPTHGTCDFYYVDPSGKVAFYARDSKTLLNKFNSLLRTKRTGDAFFGSTPVPESLSAVTNILKSGKSTAPAYAFLKRHLKGPDAAAAQALTDALDATCRYRVMRLQRMAYSCPGAAMLESDALQKEFPHAKSNPRGNTAVRKIKSCQDVAAMAKIVESIEEMRATEPSSPADSKRRLALAKADLARLAKLKESKSSAIAAEAVNYESKVLDLVSRLENQ